MRAKLIPGVLVLVLAGAAAKAPQRPLMDGLMACRADMEAPCGSDRADRPKVRQSIIENRDKVSDDCKRALDAIRNGPGAGAMPTVTVSYGNDARQAIDFYRARGTGTAPLIVFIHGGAWSMGDKRQASGRKPGHFTGAGYAFASINYRLVPQATVEQQAADVASAIDMLRFRAEEYGIDPNRIALMGHSAGAHLAALSFTNGICPQSPRGRAKPRCMYSWILAQFCYNAVFVKDVTISHRSDVTTRCFRGIPSESSLPMDPESLHERILCWLKVATPYRGRMMSLDRAHSKCEI